ncbi:1-acyl-sn-glycerol-3-phosphate acyltransferase alpha-like [Hetaerina americana]|uniref:1-acyl-sn-glycerol-3-phosphate acyltransferase alpha-like n=1 Tax=Hetaerina americana TaxID=62018 RepID=UPI003A7F25C7
MIQMALNSTELVIVGLVLILPFLYETSKVFRYYIKFCLYYGIVMAIAVFVIPIMMWRPGEVKNLLLASVLCRHISGLLGLKWELRGREHLEKEQACVIVANHQSSLDVLGMFELWPVMEKCTVVAKKELLYAWPFGLAAWLCGLIFIDRFNSEKARETINAATCKIKEKKIKLWVFPEGTRNTCGPMKTAALMKAGNGGSKDLMLPFKKGAFHVALSAQIPILPVVFSSYYFLDGHQKHLDPGHVIMTALPPIETRGLGPEDLDLILNRTREVMLSTFAESSLEALSNDLSWPRPSANLSTSNSSQKVFRNRFNPGPKSSIN